MTSSLNRIRLLKRAPEDSTTTTRPGWPEIGVAALVYLVLFGVTVVVLRQVPDDDDVTSGLLAYVMSAVMGLGAFAAACTLRLKALRPFGVRRVAGKWLAIGFAIGAVAWWLNIFVSVFYAAVTGDNSTPQDDYKSAGDAGALALLLTLLFGAVATPIGEELAFRGVLANALNRYGWWAGIVLSSAVFALAHGVNVVLPVAFVIGILCALLFRRTGSIWPGVFVHLANNASAILIPMLLS